MAHALEVLGITLADFVFAFVPLQYRGKHDSGNVFAGGFVSGLIIQRHNGMKSGILSGIGFGLFGAA